MRVRLTKEQAETLGLKVKTKQGEGNPRYSVTSKQFNSLGVTTEKKKEPLKTTEKPFVLSAWNDGGYMMCIDEYCTHYKLPRKDISSYKLVSHTGTPFYNIQFKQNTIEEEIDYTFIDSIVKKHIKEVEIKIPEANNTGTFDRLIFTDVHIGMTTNKDGFALYPTEWNEEELNNRLAKMVGFVLNNKQSDTLVIDELGDFLDGWDAMTTRKGHSLPQNMDNQKAFDTAVKFKVQLISNLAEHYNGVLLNNICEDNHAGSFGYVVNSAVKSILEIKFKNVLVVNHRKFINHYFIGKHCFIISHGKDSKNLKFGFKPVLDTKQIEKIDQYCKKNDIYRNSEFIEFSKGDSHQMIFDYATSDDFDYCNYPAFSPSSEWVQTNFKAGRSGFVMQVINNDSNDKKVFNKFF